MRRRALPRKTASKCSVTKFWCDWKPPNKARGFNAFVKLCKACVVRCMLVLSKDCHLWSCLTAFLWERCDYLIRARTVKFPRLMLSVKTQRTTVAAALTQTVGRGIHNPRFRRRLLFLEEQRALRCVFHADRGESQPTLWRLESMTGLWIPETRNFPQHKAQ